MSVASEIEVCSIYATTQQIRAAAAKQADTCVARVVWDVESGGGLTVHRHSYRGHRVEL